MLMMGKNYVTCDSATIENERSETALKRWEQEISAPIGHWIQDTMKL